MSNNKAVHLRSLLIDLEAGLRNMQCWDLESPASEALNSVEPFCVDTLEFYQWLQWIFIPRIHSSIELNQPLPSKCDIAPMAEEWLRIRTFESREIIRTLSQIDFVISN